MHVAEQFRERMKKIDVMYPSYKDTSITHMIRREKMQLYNEAVAKLNHDFKFVLFEYYGVMDNPKAERCFQLAWEHGHSDGYNEVEIHFSVFVDLIK